MYPHFWAHQAARPIFQDDNTRPHRARIVTDYLAQEGIENLQWLSRSPDMNPIEYFLDCMGRNVCKLNDVVTLDDLVRALVDEWNNLEPRFLRKLVQGMPRRVRELHQRRGGYTCYWRRFLKRRWAWCHWVLVSNLSKTSSETFLLITMYFLNKNIKFYQFKHKLVFAFKICSFGWHCAWVLNLPLLYRFQWNVVFGLPIHIDASECNDIFCWKKCS